MAKVYLVEDTENAPGRVLAVFNSKQDAYAFMYNLPGSAEVVARTLFYGQPSVRGYNE